MAERIIHIFTEGKQYDTLEAIAKEHDALDYWHSIDKDGRMNFEILAGKGTVQNVVDAVQTKLMGAPHSRIMLLPIDAYIPTKKEKIEAERVRKAKEGSSDISREELHSQLARGADCDTNYLLLVAFSTIVAAIGMMEDNVAVIVGAMVIAPFLGPNLALTLGTALGDTKLIKRALKTLLSGTALAFILAYMVGWFWPDDLASGELMSRSNVYYSSIVLALAAGGAAVLSLTKGISSVMVGVMVAVALLPPLAACAVFIGLGQYIEAAHAMLLLAVNIVCINLSGLLVFITKGIGPRNWWEKRKAKSAVYIGLAIWSAALFVLTVVIGFQ